MKYTYITLVILLFCGLLPNLTHAATASLITNTVAVFTIDFTIEDDSYITELPIAASSTVKYTDKVDYIGVRVENEAGESAKGATNAILLGTAPIVGTHYQLASTTSRTFTLLIITTFDEPVIEPYTARLTKLPFWADGRRSTVHQNQLNEFPSATLKVK